MHRMRIVAPLLALAFFLCGGAAEARPISLGLPALSGPTAVSSPIVSMGTTPRPTARAPGTVEGRPAATAEAQVPPAPPRQTPPSPTPPSPTLPTREPGPAVSPVAWPAGMALFGAQLGGSLVLATQDVMRLTSDNPHAANPLYLAVVPAALVGALGGALLGAAHDTFDLGTQRRLHNAAQAYTPGMALGMFTVSRFMYPSPAALSATAGGILASVAAGTLLPTSISMTRTALWSSSFLVGTATAYYANFAPAPASVLAGPWPLLAAPGMALAAHFLVPEDAALNPERIALAQWGALGAGLAATIWFGPYGALVAPVAFAGGLWVATLVPDMWAPGVKLAMGQPLTVLDKAGQPVSLAPIVAVAF